MGDECKYQVRTCGSDNYASSKTYRKGNKTHMPLQRT